MEPFISTTAGQLPNAHLAQVAMAKVTEYLLNIGHEVGGPKARFFLSKGYSLDEPQILERDLLHVAATGQVTRFFETEYGWRYTVEGRVTAPNEEEIRICSGWQVDTGADAPRLLSAYPG